MIRDEEKQELGVVILAGGEGSSLLPLTRRITGQDTSKLSKRFDSNGVSRLYEKLPSINLSDQVFASYPANLAVLPLSGLEWSDLGEPSRVIAALENERIRPKWAVGE